MVEIDGLRLWQAQQSTDALEAQMDVTSVQGEGESQSFVVALEAVETMTLAGRATGVRLTGESGYSSDPQTALSQWVQQFESLASPEQGEGWSVTDDERNRSITATVSGLSWTFAYGSPADVRWSLDLNRGEGVATSASRSPSSQTPNSASTLAGDDLGTVTEKRTELRLDLRTIPMALRPTSEQVLVPQTGVVRQVTMTGRKSGTTAELRTFDSNMRGRVGGADTELTYVTGMPGTTHQVHIGDYASTYVAGATAHLNWAMMVFEGISL